MSASTTVPASTVRPGRERITASGLLRSEWRKIWSLRSLSMTLTAGFALTIGLCSYMIIDGTALGGEDAGHIPFGWTAIYPVGMLVLVVLGVLSVSSEYSSGSIRTTLTTAPRRTGVMLAKVVVVTGTVAVLAGVTTVLMYLLLRIMGTVPSAARMSLFDPDMFWGALGGTLMLPYGTLFGVLLGWLLRNAAAAICLYFGLFQMGPQILPAFLPESLADVTDYMPLTAINVIRSGGLSTGPYGNVGAAIVLVGWLAALGGIAWWRLKKRDG